MEPQILDLSDLSDHPSSKSEEDMMNSPAKATQDQFSEKTQKKLQKQIHLFREQLIIVEQYFKVAESAIAELRQTTDLTENS